MARISCQSRLVSDAWRRYAARKGRFSRPRPLRERMKRKSCHGSPPGNASRRNIATVSHSRMHYSYILPIKSLHSCAKVQHARFSPCRIRAAVGHGERCRRCSIERRKRFRRRIQSWCWAVGCRRTPGHGRGRRLQADTRPRAGPSAAGWALGHGTAVGCGQTPTTGGRPSAARLRTGTPPRGGDCRLRAGPPAAARSAASRLSAARTSTMPKTRMNPFTPTFPRCCTVIGFICYVTNI